MDALIIAAGWGSRLRSLAPIKPLVPVRGIPLIEIAVRQVVRAGATRVVVVTGYRGEEVEAILSGISRSLHVGIEACRIEDWSRPNGYSVMAGAARIRGNYLLVMADHILSDPILSGLVARDAPADGVRLAIDRRTTNPRIDPDDATWVALDERAQIRAIGKDILSYHAVDCGAFLASPALAAAIAYAIAEGRSGSLSDGVQHLADQGRGATLDVGENWWIDVDDPHAYALAEAEVFQSLPHLSGERASSLREEYAALEARYSG